MDKYTIFIDESGTATIGNPKTSPYFTVCGFVSSQKTSTKLKESLNALKFKYFKNKSYILHNTEIRRDLKYRKRSISDFAKDLNLLLRQHNFFLLFVIVDKNKALEWSWKTQTVYRKSYKEIIGNLVKFLIAKDVVGSICSEASSIQQDLFIYQAFVHYVANGIDELSISYKEVKEHLTSLSFVTKLNNDAEEQIADLFGSIGRTYIELQEGKRSLENLDPIEQVLIASLEKNMFNGLKAKIERKKQLYNKIVPMVILPQTQKTG
ncbi:MAG: DUF3800 domain-containing protein [Patescibacteria group bacterium]